MAFSALGLNSDLVNYTISSRPVLAWRQKNHFDNTLIYSRRSMYQHYFLRTIDSKQGPKLSEMKNLCDNGLNVLITRHPIVRIISSWNDKFGWNSTEGSGFAYGVKQFLKKKLGLSKAFPEAVQLLLKINKTELADHQGFSPKLTSFIGRYNLFRSTTGPSPPIFPRPNQQYPWHLINFSDFLAYYYDQWQTHGGFMQDLHFKVF